MSCPAGCAVRTYVADDTLSDRTVIFSNNKNTIVELSDEILARYNKDYTYDNASYLTRI